MSDEVSEEWQDAIKMDRLIRNGGTKRGLPAQQNLHRPCQPLDQVDLDRDVDAGQLNLMLEECDGICGV